MIPLATDCLIVVDVQNDFCAGGGLEVPDGDAVVPIINQMARGFDNVVLTQDWHPAGHSSFATAHDGRVPYDVIDFDYGPQTLWPDHCIQETDGAAFHADLHIPHACLVVRKGFRRKIDSYSAFFENDKTTPTGLAGYLRERGARRVFVAGLALDFCVRFTVEDAARLDFETVLVADACRAVAVEGSERAAERSMTELGIGRLAARELGAD